MEDRALIEAVKAGDISAVESLLNSGADINQVDDQGWTPLSFASGMGNLSLVKLLVERGSDVFKVGRDNRTPYMIALAAGRVDVVKFLGEVENRIDPEKSRQIRPDRIFCKAYYLRKLREFPQWSESRINWKETTSNTDSSFDDEKVVFIHQDLTVTESMWHNENVIFNQVTSEWREFCSGTLKFKVPDDSELIPESDLIPEAAAAAN